MNLATKLLDPDADLAILVDQLFRGIPGDPLDKIDPKYWERALLEPARDILSRSGKGFRARLVEACWRLGGGLPGEHPEALPILIELLHAGSLVIDDIEDDSSMRRGKPALHRRYGVPLALNTGNWLYFLPLAVLSELDLAADVKLAFYQDISRAVLHSHQGQALDLSVRIHQVPQRELPRLVARSTQLKTGALMELAARLGARAAGAPRARLRVLARFGRELGVALQMLDDWMGMAAPHRRAKGIEDIRLSRPTWPWAWLAQECREAEYGELRSEAREIGDEPGAVRLVERLRRRLAGSAPRHIRGHLEGALDHLGSEVGESSHLASLRREVERLERAYA